jgi:hypothetical protein
VAVVLRIPLDQVPMPASLGDEPRFRTLHTHEASANFKLRDPLGYVGALNADYAPPRYGLGAGASACRTSGSGYLRPGRLLMVIAARMLARPARPARAELRGWSEQ